MHTEHDDRSYEIPSQSYIDTSFIFVTSVHHDGIINEENFKCIEKSCIFFCWYMLSFLYNLQQTDDPDSFLSEERRLLHSERRSNKRPVTNEISQKRLGKFNARVNHMTPEQLDEELKNRQLSTRLFKKLKFNIQNFGLFVISSGKIDIRRARIKNHFKSEFTIIEQHFEYIAVVDFEATCEENAGTNYPHEIIEFPIVLIDVQQQTIVNYFNELSQSKILFF